MNNWYSTGIALLGGVAIGLLAFLFIQPADTGNESTDTAINSSAPDQAKSDGSNMEDAAASGGPTADTTQENSVDSEPNSSVAPSLNEGQVENGQKKSEEWEGEINEEPVPELIFYYKPG